jgi:hypothetical protein
MRYISWAPAENQPMNRMKSWESPRRGRRRNDRSKAAIARLRQLKKRNQRLRQKLRQQSKPPQAHSSGGLLFVSIKADRVPSKAATPLES